VTAHFSKKREKWGTPVRMIQLSKATGVIIATPEKVATRPSRDKFGFQGDVDDTPHFDRVIRSDSRVPPSQE